MGLLALATGLLMCERCKCRVEGVLMCERALIRYAWLLPMAVLFFSSFFSPLPESANSLLPSEILAENDD